MRILLTVILILGLKLASAQWAGSNNIHINGSGAESQYVSSGNWKICWNNDSLYVFKSGGSGSEPAILFFDIDPVYPVTWGTNADGSVIGTTDYGVTANLPFRADLRIYWTTGAAPVFNHRNSSNGWASGNNLPSGDYANNGSDRELRIAWNAFPGISARPSRFNFFAYCLNTASTAYTYDALPDNNPNNGTFVTPNCEYYWRCNNTSSSGTHNPFDYRCYTYLGTGGALGNIGVSPVLYDFTLNKASTTINKNGKWVFRGYMCVSDGIIEFDSNADSLIVEDSLTVMGTGRIDMESATSKVWVKRDVSNRATGTPGTDLKLSSNSSAELRIGGNFRNYAGFEAVNTPIVMQDPRSPQTMQMIHGNFKGDSALHSLEVNNSAGLRIWPEDSLVVRNTLSMTTGKLDVDEGRYLRLRNGCTVNNSGGPSDGRFVEGWLTREIHSTDSTLFHVGDGSNMARVAIAPASAQSGRAYTVRYIPVGHEYSGNLSATRVGSSGLDHASLVEYWKIFCDHSTDDAELTLFWTAHSVVSATSSDWQNLRVGRWIGGSTNEWTIDGSTPYNLGASTSDGFVDAKSNTTTFADSVFTIASTTTANPLPVKMLHFGAGWNDHQEAEISWSTATEINNQGFELYHSTDGREWHFLDWIHGAGNTIITQSYQRNYLLNPTLTHYFKLRQLDFDGGSEEFGPVVLKAEKKSDLSFTLNRHLRLLQVTFPENVAFKLLDMGGRLILSGKTNEQIDINYLSSGLYVIQLNEVQFQKCLILF